MWWASAFVIGLVGSLHCVLMCGPLMGAVAGKSVWGFTLYHLGRITVYALLGALFGLLGRGIALAGWQQGLSVALGLVLLSMAFVPRLLSRSSGWQSKIFRWLGKQNAHLFQQRNKLGFLAPMSLGALNGLLPCGLVYAGIAGATLSAGIAEGALYMTFMGLGTLPAMILVAAVFDRLRQSFRMNLSRWYPVGMAVVGLFLLLRGASLDIPYLSPILELNLGPLGITNCR